MIQPEFGNGREENPHHIPPKSWKLHADWGPLSVGSVLWHTRQVSLTRVDEFAIDLQRVRRGYARQN